MNLPHSVLDQIIDTANIDDLDINVIAALFEDELGDSQFLLDGQCQIDPRNQDRILFNAARAKRPRDNKPVRTAPKMILSEETQECIVCNGQLTRVLDVVDLSEGFTFINKNLYPAVYLTKGEQAAEAGRSNSATAQGLHFLQWTSSYHDRDWHNMPLGDCVIVLSRLGALERKMLSSGLFSDGYISIFKNYGRLVGGSIAHGHQQIVYSSQIPGRLANYIRFEKEHGEKFTEYLLRELPLNLIVKDYGPAFLIVPYFMRRPYDLFWVLKDTKKGYLHQLSQPEMEAMAAGLQDAIRFIRDLMPAIGREVAYNVIVNNGPGAGLYVEFLPYTQETGGLEHLGLLVCQGTPALAAEKVREILSHGV